MDDEIRGTVDVVVTDWGSFRLDDLVARAERADLGEVADVLRVLASEVWLLKRQNRQLYTDLEPLLPRYRPPRWWEVWRKPSPGYGDD